MGGLSLALSREGSVRGTRENSMHAGRMSREASARGERSTGNRRRGSGGQDELELDSCGNRTHRGLLVLGDRGNGNAAIPQGCASSDAREAYAPSGPSIREAPDGEEQKVRPSVPACVLSGAGAGRYCCCDLCPGQNTLHLAWHALTLASL